MRKGQSCPRCPREQRAEGGGGDCSRGPGTSGRDSCKFLTWASRRSLIRKRCRQDFSARYMVTFADNMSCPLSLLFLILLETINYVVLIFKITVEISKRQHFKTDHFPISQTPLNICIFSHQFSE